MSQVPYQAIPMENVTGGHRDVLQSIQHQTSQGQSNFSDGSEPLFNMYVKMAEEEDNKMAERWKEDADGILIFTGLFSAAVAALVAVSIQDLRPGPQDNSEFYLGNIYQLLADSNVSRASILAGSAKPPPFSPPKYAIWVNSLWFLSLAINLTCALLATLLQQWARRYLTVTQPPRYSPHKRARIRVFLADGIDNLHVPWAVETLPTLLHVSLLLFFSGLLVFLFNIHHTVFSVVVWWVGLSVGMYVCITLMPIFRPDSPYYAPLSSSAMIVYTGVSYGVFRVLTLGLSGYLSYATWKRFDNLMNTYRQRLWRGVVKTAQETASVLSAKNDRRVLRRIFDALDEDHELEQFFECIPGFCSSEVVDDPKGILAEMDSGNRDLTNALIRFWDNTLTSSFVTETIKKKRLMTCVKAAGSARLSFAARTILQRIILGGVDAVLRSVEIGHSLISLGNSDDEGLALLAQAIVARIIASIPVGERDYRWTTLVMDQLDITEDVLRGYLAHGDSVLLANLIHFTRQYFHSCQRLGGDPVNYATQYILLSISEVHLQDTLPVLQHDFCALWNEIVLEARKNTVHGIPFYILRHLRQIYIALHRGTDSAPTTFSASTDEYNYILTQSSSYPLCNIPGHASHALVVHASAATLSTVPHPDAVLPVSTISPFAGPDMSRPPTLSPHHRRVRSDEPSLHDIPQTTAIVESSHVTPPANLENNQFPAISLESATVATNPGPDDTSTIPPTASSEFDLHLTPPAASASITQLLVPLPPSTSTVATEQHNGDLGAVPQPVMPFSTLAIPAPGNVAPADPHAASASQSQVDQLTPGLGFLPQSSVPTFSSPAPQVTSVSHTIMAPNDAAFDTHDNSRAPDFSTNSMEALHHPYQLDMSVPDIATGLSRHSLDTVSSSPDTDCPEQK